VGGVFSQKEPVKKTGGGGRNINSWKEAVRKKGEGVRYIIEKGGEKE